MANGSENIKLIVNTAINSCQVAKMEFISAFKKDDLNKDYVAAYLHSLDDNARDAATSIVLKRKLN